MLAQFLGKIICNFSNAKLTMLISCMISRHPSELSYSSCHEDSEPSASYLNQLRTKLQNYEEKANLLQTANCPISGKVNCAFLRDGHFSKKQIPIVDSDIMTTEKNDQQFFDLIQRLAEQQEELHYD